MEKIRGACQQDREKFYELWKICFGDSDAFCDWFYTNRFSPEHSVVLETDGEIISCMQAFPYTLQIRGKEVPGAMLCGVSTHPEHRKKGYMGKIFSYEMNHLRNMGYAAAPHTPAVLPSYFSFGHFPVADAAYLTSDQIPEIKLPEHICAIDRDMWEHLFPVYEAFSAKYSGIIKRTKEDFLRKAADYAADGGKAIAYIEKNVIRGYAFYYQTETEIICVEAVAEEPYWKILMEGLFSFGAGAKFTAKLPPDIAISFPFTALERKQKGVMGLCNVSDLLKVLELDIPYGFQLKDAVVPENNGIFDFYGALYHGEPVFEISSGHLLQVLIGYHTLHELKNEIKVFDQSKFEEIDNLLVKQNCYIIDEY